MGWTETCALDERHRFVLALEAGAESFAQTCRRFGVSRKTGMKWQGRYLADGVAGLLDRSRGPVHRPLVVAETTWAACVEVRRAHPSWGPLKVRAYLERREPDRCWPAASSIGLLFDREGLTVKRKLNRRRRR
jgi:putative transposase